MRAVRAPMWVRVLALLCVLAPAGFGQSSGSDDSAPGLRGALVAHLVVRGDLDARRLADEIVSWIKTRDASREAIAVMEFDARLARLDLVLRIVEAMETASVPTVVLVNAKEPVAPGVLMMALAADEAFLGRGVSIAGDPQSTIPDLCEDAATGWRGRHEQRASALIEQRELPPQLVDVLIEPLGSLYVGWNDGVVVASREAFAGSVRVVDASAADAWRVELSRDVLLRLKVFKQADGIGQVLAAMQVRSARRDRTQVQSGLKDASQQAAELRQSLRIVSSRLKDRIGQIEDLAGSARAQALRSAHQRQQQAEESLRLLQRVCADYPELLRRDPPWGASVVGGPDEAVKRWSQEVAALGRALDATRLALDALEHP